MNELCYLHCSKIMKEIFDMPTNADFKLSPEKLEGYADKIKRPIDLTVINEKLQNKEYKDAYTWYKDVCLVYENAMEFYDVEHFYYKFAVYTLQVFKKLAFGLNCKDASKWYQMFRKTLDELIKVAGNSSVPQGIDPWLKNIPKQGSTVFVPLAPNEIAETVEFLNKELEKDSARKDIFAILKEMQPELKFDSDPVTIDAEKLNETTRVALKTYAQAYMKPK